MRRIGYATNLTPETVRGAAELKVDLLLTHHDAWEFIYGMRENCSALLERFQISHVYAHLPLDASDIGTSATLGRSIGASPVGKFAKVEGFPCGRICEYSDPVPMSFLVQKMNELCEEECQTWINHDKLITRVGVVTGGGMMTTDVKESHSAGCDAYITGERNLYLVQYCRFIEMNLIVGSHTFTELPGVRALAQEIKKMHSEIEILQVQEKHVELMPNKGMMRLGSRCRHGE